jgi:hypothetical protein
MLSITEFLEKQLKTMQKEKAEEKQVLIDKLQRQLKSVHSLAEERKNRIQSLESESTSKAFSVEPQILKIFDSRPVPLPQGFSPVPSNSRMSSVPLPSRPVPQLPQYSRT